MEYRSSIWSVIAEITNTVSVNFDVKTLKSKQNKEYILRYY